MRLCAVARGGKTAALATYPASRRAMQAAAGIGRALPDPGRPEAPRRLTSSVARCHRCPTHCPETASLPQQLSLHSPVGDLTISADGGAIVAIDWGWVTEQTETPLLVEARRQLHDYFDGKRSDFALALAPAGTDYQRRVWQALCAIPPGSTRTYADIARAVGGSPRAVGGANGRNPIPIVIPCHRVVATGGIGGYSGGDGLPTKRFLLALERAEDAATDLFAARDGAGSPAACRPPSS